ncbi:MAG TPA: recombinase family protein [Ktedonobacteraceae bacterium]|nr:recombinase family protein [Ktedonobacteraceae bacterium]
MAISRAKPLACLVWPEYAATRWWRSKVERTSALTEKRKGMKQLMGLIKERAIEVILIESPDRLVRFSFGYPEEACSWQGVRLEVLDRAIQLEPTEELVQDLLMIVTVFADRLSGSGAKGVRARVKAARKRSRGSV